MNFFEISSGIHRLRSLKNVPNQMILKNSSSVIYDDLLIRGDCEIYLRGSGKLSYFLCLFPGENADQIRRNMTFYLESENAKLECDVLFFGNRQQQLILNLQQIHRCARSHSSARVKTLLDDRAAAQLHCKIVASAEASESQAFLKSTTILLSSEAKVIAIPTLEIAAPHMQCSHGATASGIPSAEIFYMQSRGIGMGEGKRIFANAFMASIFNKMPRELRQELPFPTF